MFVRRETNWQGETNPREREKKLVKTNTMMLDKMQ